MLDFVQDGDHADLMKIALTAEQKIALEMQHRQNRDRRVCDRIHCVLLCSEGWSPVMIAQSQRIDETYAVCVDFLDERQIRRWSDERKAATRRRNLEKRIQRTAPLFADELIERELALRPEYFQGKCIKMSPEGGNAV